MSEEQWGHFRERRDYFDKAVVKLCSPLSHEEQWGHFRERGDYRGTSLIRNTPLLGPYSGNIPRFLRRS